MFSAMRIVNAIKMFEPLIKFALWFIVGAMISMTFVQCVKEAFNGLYY